jgi:hypothetical protein
MIDVAGTEVAPARQALLKILAIPVKKCEAMV